jgi:hypothetical protein
MGDRCGAGDIVVFVRGRRLVAHRLLLAWPVGISRPLDSPTAHWPSRRAIRRSLKTMLRDHVLALTGGVTRWRSQKPTASA